MTDKTFVIRFKPPELPVHAVIASTAEIHGDHLVLINSKGALSALLLLEVVESLSELS